MNSDDEAWFRQQLGDVQPLKQVPRVALQRDGTSELARRARRRAAVAATGDDNHLSDAPLPLLDAYYPLEYKRAGIQQGVFRRLKQGRYAWEARLDLHGMRLEQARREVFVFVRDARAQDLRSVMIVHGRGHHTAQQGALLKTYVNHWLQDMAEVQAFCSAQPQHGGVGAVYLLLGKSEQAKRANRELFAKGRNL